MRTLASMDRDLRSCLTSRKTVLMAKKLRGQTLAYVDYDGPTIDITVDPMRGGLIASVVHELIHAVYRRQLAAWGHFEEVIVVALEQSVMAHIDAKPERVKWWRDAIARKLSTEGDA